MKLWLRYPLSTAVRWLEDAGIEVRAHVLVIGPLGFLVCWKVKGRQSAVAVWQERERARMEYQP